MLERQIAELVVSSDQFRELEQALDVFCPFEAIGMVNQEIRHGYFLSYIFDPNRPHGFGDECLRALIRAAARAVQAESQRIGLLDAHLMELSSARVRREWNNIDLIIEVPERRMVIAIELKIDASEHSGQLGRYQMIVEREWPDHEHRFLFLTKRGDEPSEDGGRWQPVELDRLVAELAAVSGRFANGGRATDLLNAYLAMLGRHHLNDDKLEALANALWTRHRAALDFLSDRRPNAAGDLFQRLVDGSQGIAESISALSQTPVTVDYTRRAAIYFAVPEWDEIPGFTGAEGFTPSNRLLLIELAKSGSDFFRCYFILGRGDPAMRLKLFNCLRDAGAEVGKKSSPTRDWNRLASMRISLPNLEEEQNLDASHGRVLAQVRDFVVRHLPDYSRALAPLLHST